MKNTLLTIALSLFSISLFAISIDEIQDDTTRIKTKNKIILIIEGGDEDFDFDDDTLNHDDSGVNLVLSLDLGATGYLTSSNSLSLPATHRMMELNSSKSTSLGVNFMLQGANIVKKWLYISPGIGLSSNDYHFKSNIQITTGSDTTMFVEDTIITFDKYELRVNYIQVPLMLGFRFGNPDKKPIGLQVGAIGGFKTKSRVKQKYIMDDTKFKKKIKDDFNINPFKVDLVARLSVGNFGIFGKYSISTLFEKNKALELYPFSVGFTFGGFK